MTISIEEFYNINKVDDKFDEISYQEQNPGVRDFYQPYCSDNKIDDKHRLFFHYVMYSKRHDPHKYASALSNVFNNLIDLNIALESNDLSNFIHNNVSSIFSSMRDPVQYNAYVDRRNKLHILERLIPFLPQVNIEILPENII